MTRLMPGYSPFEKVRIMNLFSTISEMQIHVNLSSGFAAVSYPSITSAAVWYIVYAGNLLQSPWLNITGEPRSSVVLTMKPRLPISGAGEDNWYVFSDLIFLLNPINKVYEPLLQWRSGRLPAKCLVAVCCGWSGRRRRPRPAAPIRQSSF